MHLLTLKKVAIVGLSLWLLMLPLMQCCQQCYREYDNNHCRQQAGGQESYTLHMSVHPHLDAFWIFDFERYYKVNLNDQAVQQYFWSNKMTAVEEIFNTAKKVLWASRNFRKQNGISSQEAHRSFFNSEMGFFKRWYNEQPATEKTKVKELLKTKYWEILGGGIVEHDEGCAYYDDIIENFQLGLRFLKTEFDYRPKVAIAADSFGHSQSTLAILAHIGIQGYFVERSDEHILLQNKTEFIWQAKSANGMIYGALPTHVRWAIHGFEDQFNQGSISQVSCDSKEMYIANMRRQNQFLKHILNSPHIMRYFGHDFQKFDEYSYKVIETMMEQFSKEKCRKVAAVYGNPTQYFTILMSQVFAKKKAVPTRSEDIMPIWDYDSGLYWTGYYTTDPYHKKQYRDVGRYLYALRKICLPWYLKTGSKAGDAKLEELAEQVAYLQHHDGISGTSKYSVMDSLEFTNIRLLKAAHEEILLPVFNSELPIIDNQILFECNLDERCVIPRVVETVIVRMLSSDSGSQLNPLIIQLPFGEYYVPVCDNCAYEINCFCVEKECPCKLYLLQQWLPRAMIKLERKSPQGNKIFRLQPFAGNYKFQANSTHLTVKLNTRSYAIGYKFILAEATSRNYAHLSRYGDKVQRSFSIRSGKYALGNNPNKIRQLSELRKVYWMETDHFTFLLLRWERNLMKTLISIPHAAPNEWKVETVSAAEAGKLGDLYLEVSSSVANQNKFFTDSNGWLVMQRELFKHEDYEAYFSPNKLDDINGNSYPVTAFIYIEDAVEKVSVNTDRPQGGIVYKPGTIWLNFDRLTSDDGKWVFETTYRSEYQRFTHFVTVQNKNGNERIIQQRYDQPRFVIGTVAYSNAVREDDKERQKVWQRVAGFQQIKFSVRTYNDSTLLLRVQSMKDKNEKDLQLYAGNICTLLTSYYGRMVRFAKIEEMSLGGNLKYEDFLADKWNWKQTIDLSTSNQIFQKSLRQRITLRPLEIRTFRFTDLTVADTLEDVSSLRYVGTILNYKLDTEKQMPRRNQSELRPQKEIIKYLIEEDHCTKQSPLLQIRDLPAEEYDRNQKNLVKESPQQQQQPWQQQQQWQQQWEQQQRQKSPSNSQGRLKDLQLPPDLVAMMGSTTLSTASLPTPTREKIPKISIGQTTPRQPRNTPNIPQTATPKNEPPNRFDGDVMIPSAEPGSMLPSLPQKTEEEKIYAGVAPIQKQPLNQLKPPTAQSSNKVLSMPSDAQYQQLCKLVQKNVRLTIDQKSRYFMKKLQQMRRLSL